MAQPRYGGRMLTVCAACGTAYERRDRDGSRCPDCTPPDDGTRDRQPARAEAKAGYDWSWRKLSIRARKLQPWCSDCGSPYDLTTDHSEQAWQRHEQGLPIRLRDVDVVCRSCNTDRGAARGTDSTDRDRLDRHLDRLAELADQLDRDPTELDDPDDLAALLVDQADDDPPTPLGE